MWYSQMVPPFLSVCRYWPNFLLTRSTITEEYLHWHWHITNVSKISPSLLCVEKTRLHFYLPFIEKKNPLHSESTISSFCLERNPIQLLTTKTVSQSNDWYLSSHMYLRERDSFRNESQEWIRKRKYFEHKAINKYLWWNLMWACLYYP